MFAIYDKSVRCFYRGSLDTPEPGRRKALRFTSVAQAQTEISTMQMTGSWPLFAWRVVQL